MSTYKSPKPTQSLVMTGTAAASSVGPDQSFTKVVGTYAGVKRGLRNSTMDMYGDYG